MNDDALLAEPFARQPEPERKTVSAASAHELRVLAGAHSGARIDVRAGTPLVVGSAWDSDVVLRADDIGERRVVLTLRERGVHLHVLAGSVTLGTRELLAGQTAMLPLFSPLTLGGAQLALGACDDAHWSLPTPGAAPEHAPAATPAAPRIVVRPAWTRALVGLGSALAIGSLGAMAIAYAAAPATPTPSQQAQQTQAMLQGAGFPRLAAKADDNGDIVVSGYLETAAQRSQVERMVAKHLAEDGQPVRLSVFVNEQVAAGVRDVYRTNGIVAQVEATGPGAVAVRTQHADAAQLAQVQATARRDVAGLSVLEARNAAPALQRTAAANVVDDPGKRIASVVPGDPAYLVTADGTRYFEGALLPTGHRIASIKSQEVMLDLDGAMSPLRF